MGGVKTSIKISMKTKAFAALETSLNWRAWAVTKGPSPLKKIQALGSSTRLTG
jgi:hypothetical protein